MYQPHPFHWIPAQGKRHASSESYAAGVQGYPDGSEVSMLCEQKLAADNSPLAWLWDTCESCNVAAHLLAAGASV